MILRELYEISSDKELLNKYESIVEELSTIISKITKDVVTESTIISEAPSIISKFKDAIGNIKKDTQRVDRPKPGEVDSGDLVADLEVVIKQLSAAKRGLGLTNKLRDPGERAINRSRVMGHLNRIRANLRRIEKKIASDPAFDDYM